MLQGDEFLSAWNLSTSQVERLLKKGVLAVDEGVSIELTMNEALVLKATHDSYEESVFRIPSSQCQARKISG